MRIFISLLVIGCCCGQTISGQSLSDRYSGQFDTLIAAKQYDQAFILAQQWEQAAQAENGDESFERALGLSKMGTCAYRQKQFGKADSLLQRSTEIIQKNHFEDNLATAKIWRQWSAVSRATNQLQPAFVQLQNAYAITQKLLGKDDPYTLETLMQLGIVAVQIGEKQMAEQAFLDCLSAYERKKDALNPDYLKCLHLTGMFYFQDLQIKKAEFYLKKCLVLKKEQYGEASTSYLETLNLLAQLYKFLGKMEEAETISQQLVEIARSGKSDMSQMEIAEIFSVLGIIQRELKIFGEGIKNLEEARRICQANYPDDPINALIFRELALLYNEVKMYAQADSCFQQSIAINEKIYGPDADQTLIVTGWWAQTLCNRKQQSAAAALLEKVEKNALTSKDFSCDKSVIYLHSKGLYLYNEKRYQAAVAYFDQAIEVAYQTENTVGWLGHILGNKFQLYDDWGKPELAIAAYREYLKMENDLFLDALQTLTDRERFQTFETELLAFAHLGSFALRNTNMDVSEDIINLQLFVKNILENTTRKTMAFVQHSSDAQIVQEYNQWLESRDELSNALQFPPEEATRRGLDLKEMEATTEALEEKLVRKGVPIVRQDTAANWTTIRNALQPGEAALDIMRFQLFQNGSFHDTAIYAISIIKPGVTRPELVFLENGNELESFAAGQYQSEISRKKDVSAAVYEKMWAPVAAHLNGVSTLYFSPDGIFHKINLSTLRKPDGSYLVDNLALVQVTNLRHILERSPENAGMEPGVAALFGNPAFGNAAISGPGDAVDQNYRDVVEESGGYFKLTPLPGSKREVEQIAQKLSAQKWQPVVFTGAQATEDTLKKCKNPKVLHIATHGYFLNAEKKTDTPGFASPAAAQNPALRSMLFFTGAENTLNGHPADRNDGILTAFEAAVLPLDRTELVVLSACNTGLGKIQNGEGVYGLQRAFRIAGAKSLIMSLWEVEDKATELFMTHFYDNWTSGMSKTAAFRKAQQTLKAKYPQPFYWGSFVLVNG